MGQPLTTPAEIPRWVRTVTLKPPSIDDNSADADRLAAGLRALLKTPLDTDPEIVVDLPVLKTLPALLRKWP